MILGVSWGRPLDTLFELSQFHDHDSWLLCEGALDTYEMVEFGKQLVDVEDINRGCHTSFLPFSEVKECGTLSLNDGGPILGEWKI